jgi:hypothetical protein
MCFGGGTPDYTKKDYGALPSLGTGSASKTVTLGEAAPMRGSRSGSSSSLIDETMAAARASSKSGGGIDDQRAARTSALRKSSTYSDAPKKKSLFSFLGFN